MARLGLLISELAENEKPSQLDGLIVQGREVRLN